MLFWFLALAAIAWFVIAALWWSRRLMRRGDALVAPPCLVCPLDEFTALFGSPEMVELAKQIEEHRDDLLAFPCFACNHLPVFHLDPQSACECCTQAELIDIDLEAE